MQKLSELLKLEPEEIKAQLQATLVSWHPHTFMMQSSCITITYSESAREWKKGCLAMPMQ